MPRLVPETKIHDNNLKMCYFYTYEIPEFVVGTELGICAQAGAGNENT